jgi:hypothetical protein
VTLHRAEFIQHEHESLHRCVQGHAALRRVVAGRKGAAASSALRSTIKGSKRRNGTRCPHDRLEATKIAANVFSEFDEGPCRGPACSNLSGPARILYKHPCYESRTTAQCLSRLRCDELSPCGGARQPGQPARDRAVPVLWL